MVNILQMRAGARASECVGRVLMCVNILHQAGDPNLAGGRGQTIAGLRGVVVVVGGSEIQVLELLLSMLSRNIRLRRDLCVCVGAVCVTCVYASPLFPEDRIKLQRRPDYLSLMQISAFEMNYRIAETEIVAEWIA